MTDTEPAGGRGGASRRRGRFAYAISMLAVLIAGAAVVAVFAAMRARGGQPPRPSGIPAGVTDSQVNLMGLSPLPAKAAPGFTLTDQDGRTLSLSQLQGKVVVLEFMDPHCTDICPIVSAEFVDAYHDLGQDAGRVVFAAVNVNAYHAKVSDMLAYSREQQLVTIPDWHFFTGPVPDLRAVWRGYDVSVEAPSPNTDVVHTSVIYFIGPDGRERFAADPMADHTAQGTSYLPSGQLTAWGAGIAKVAGILAG
ncbi:MAG TPA: SCO family protein [Trebonia sp.]